MRPMPPRKQYHQLLQKPDPNLEVTPDETLTFKATHFYAVLVVLAFAIGILVGYVAWGRTPASPIVMQVAAPPGRRHAHARRWCSTTIPADGFPSLGPE